MCPEPSCYDRTTYRHIFHYNRNIPANWCIDYSRSFTTWKFETSFPSCSFVYYLVNITVAIIGLVAYTWVPGGTSIVREMNLTTSTVMLKSIMTEVVMNVFKITMITAVIMITSMSTLSVKEIPNKLYNIR